MDTNIIARGTMLGFVIAGFALTGCASEKKDGASAADPANPQSAEAEEKPAKSDPPPVMISPGICVRQTENECDGRSDPPPRDGVAHPNGSKGNGLDDDCDGIVDEGCNGSTAGQN